MITLITGGPGMGKTALAVSMLLDEYKGRPIFTNINGLTLDHSPLPKLEDWTRVIENDQGTREAHFTFPPGSVIVIDEAQKIYRPRPNGSIVPPHVSALETHRHLGLDFVMTTQGSRLIDSNVRALVKNGKHIFLKSSYLGRYRYEKSEVINEDDKTSYGLASKRKYTLPKHAFSLYKSSELHTKPSRAKIPLAAYVVVAAVGVGGYLAYRAGDRIGEVTAGESSGEPIVADAVAAGRAQRGPDVTHTPSSAVDPAAYTPVIPSDPATAPRFDGLRQIAAVPRIAACVVSRSRCACYTQQATIERGVTDEFCRAFAAGEIFDVYTPQPTQHAREETMPRTAATASEATKEVPPAPALEMPSAML